MEKFFCAFRRDTLNIVYYIQEKADIQTSQLSKWHVKIFNRRLLTKHSLLFSFSLPINKIKKESQSGFLFLIFTHFKTKSGKDLSAQS